MARRPARTRKREPTRTSTRKPRAGPAARLRARANDLLAAQGVRPADLRAAFAARADARALLAVYAAALDHESTRHARAAAAIRAALTAPRLDPAGVVRRLDALERVAALEHAERVVAAVRAVGRGDGASLHTSAVEAAFRELPAELTAAQWDAVIELVGLLEDRALAARVGDDPMRRFDVVDDPGEVATWRQLVDDLIGQAHGAWIRNDPPDARRGRVLATRWVNLAASLRRVSMYAAATDLLERAEGQDPRIERIWQLVASIRGWAGPPAHIAAFRWLIEAVRAHRTQFRR